MLRKRKKCFGWTWCTFILTLLVNSTCGNDGHGGIGGQVVDMVGMLGEDNVHWAC